MSVYLSSKKIIKDWIDYNNHMNVSYYLLIFDKYGADTINGIFKMGEHSAKTTGKSTMIVESNITYNQELKVDDEVDINLTYFDHDKKRLQYKMEMIHKEKKYLASTIEILALYVDLNPHIRKEPQLLKLGIFFLYEPSQVYIEVFFYHDQNMLN